MNRSLRAVLVSTSLLLVSNAALAQSNVAEELGTIQSRVFDVLASGEFEDAIPDAERGVEIAKFEFGVGSFQHSTAVQNLAYLYQSVLRFSDAEALLQQSASQLDENSPESLNAKLALVSSYEASGDHANAARILENISDTQAKLHGENSPEAQAHMLRYALTLSDAGEERKAEVILKSIADRADTNSKITALSALASVYERQQRLDAAIDIYSQLGSLDSDDQENETASIDAEGNISRLEALKANIALMDETSVEILDREQLMITAEPG